ncbi:MAG TPA: hypothetical protein VLA88_00460 [Candidatus Saccharimonadales bacterium]|nr:hypothetical protein [Candidatus Saccharimonadales bacterium]
MAREPKRSGGGQRRQGRGRQSAGRQHPSYDERLSDYREATSRPAGELDAQSGWVDGQPVLYEQGGHDSQYGLGDPRREDFYHGLNGPLRPRHGHAVYRDGQLEYYRGDDGQIYYNEKPGDF